MKKCHACGAAWEAKALQPGREETCLKCGADLHCCLNCRFYRPRMPQQCASPTTDNVQDKNKKNFCDEFEFSVTKVERMKHLPERKEFKKKWDDLFKA